MNIFARKPDKSEGLIDPREIHARDVESAREARENAEDNLYSTLKIWLEEYHEKYNEWPKTEQSIILQFAETKAKDRGIRDNLSRLPWSKLERMIITAEEAIIKEKAAQKLSQTGTEG